MSDQNPKQHALSAEITALLAGLRWRIRAYVWIEGLALAAAWIGLTFWLALAIDYLPVQLGASEMPRGARAALLMLMAAVLACILYRWVFRRSFVRLAGRSMAILLERRFPQFRDSLLTSVELRERAPEAREFNPTMLDLTDRQALSHLDLVRLRRVFNFVPLARNLTAALILVTSVVLFGVLARDAFATWFGRMYLLSSEPWPRRTHIEVLGFQDRTLKAAKGSSVTVRVRADATRPTLPPDVCTIYYRTDEGERGRANMTKTGSIRDGFQYYSFGEKPFQGLLSDIRFDVVGGDHRVRDYEVKVVPSPAVIRVELDCEMPGYTELLPRTQSWRPGTKLPLGTRVLVRAETNKDLRAGRILDVETGQSTDLAIDIRDGQPTRFFSYEIESLDRNLTLDVTLEDTDGIVSQRPHRITIDGIEDQPPVVDIALRGIGTAVTVNARVPVTGQILDDYGIDRAWLQLDRDGADSRQFPCQVGPSGAVDDVLDFRVQRAAEENPLSLAEGDKIFLTAKAADQYDLDRDGNVGEGDRFELDVVSPSDLLALLEARELGLRRRFERMIEEMREIRDSLARVQSDEAGGDEPGETQDDESSGVEETTRVADRANALRLLRVQRASQHSQRAAQEVAGVAASFDDIREELVNNRVDSQEREERIRDQISTPLTRIADEMFPAWDETLVQLQSQLGTPGMETAVVASVAQADQILVAMEAVLTKMLEVEDYNELVDMVRSLIREQEAIIERTKKERRKQLLGPLGPGPQ